MNNIPIDAEAEQAIISVLMNYPDLAGVIFDGLAASDLFDPGRVLIFGACFELYHENKPIDTVTIAMHLDDKELLKRAGGALGVDQAGQFFATHRGIVSYIERVKEMAARRALLKVGRDTEVAAKGGTPSSEIVETVRDGLASVLVGSSRVDPMVHIATAMPTVVDHIRDAELGNGLGISTGFPDIDLKVPGWSPGELYIMAARPAMGKTALMLQMAHLVAGQGSVAAIFSAEMPREQLLLRFISMQTGITVNNLRRRGRKTEAQWSSILEAADAFARLPINIDDTGGVSLTQVRARVQRLKLTEGVGFVCVDYLQLLTSGRKTKSREEEVGTVSRGLKAIAKDLEVPVLCLSQLNRKLEERKDKRPMMSDLRESGSIEQDADVIMCLYRDAVYNPSPDSEHEAELDVIKNRHGETGKVMLHWDPPRMLFSSMETRREPPPQQAYDDHGHWQDN